MDIAVSARSFKFSAEYRDCPDDVRVCVDVVSDKYSFGNYCLPYFTREQRRYHAKRATEAMDAPVVFLDRLWPFVDIVFTLSGFA